MNERVYILEISLQSIHLDNFFKL